MKKNLASFVDDAEVGLLVDFLFSLVASAEGPILLHNDILLAFGRYAEERGKRSTTCWRFLRKVQEILPCEERLLLVYRYRRANCRLYLLRRGETVLHRLSTREFLARKERLVRPDLPWNQRTLEIDLAPFYDYGPFLRDPDTIGYGIRHLNRHLSGKLAQQPQKWNAVLFEFLQLHALGDLPLLIDGKRIPSLSALESALEDAMDYLERCECPDDGQKIAGRLAELGFRPGWGNDAGRILETMQLLQDVFEQPNSEVLEEFLSRIPMVSKVAMISPHGWFGQRDVLGRPDTGGQVVYILDQARALERYLVEDLGRAGLEVTPKIVIVTRLIPRSEGTTSDQPLEKVEGSDNVWILRVPFRDPRDGRVVEEWISRFRLWPYLDQFTVDVREALLAEFGGTPDLIIGNYSDGNLVATRLSKDLGVIQCNIAHALEKSKYLFSDLYWQNFEEEYHFSIQFVADLIAMNLANFIITSTRQEITGSDTAIGQYESYQFFTMPGLMNVTSGIDLFHPRFNVIPPGVNEDVFFPYTEKERRDAAMTEDLTDMLFFRRDASCYGELADPDLPPIFSIARLDRIKNLTGLVEAYGRSERLRRQANLVIVASTLDPEASQDGEEAAEIRRMYELIDQYDLHGHIRWIGAFLGKPETGEAYRIIADRRGIFVQPALFEAFGLTILEAMHSGLPVFATKFGGPQEIIESGRSGFLINPTDQEPMAAALADFLELCGQEPEYWERLSLAAQKRVQEHFTWKLHCRQLTRLTKVYGFWKYSISNEAKQRIANYCELLYHLYFKERAVRMLS